MVLYKINEISNTEQHNQNDIYILTFTYYRYL